MPAGGVEWDCERFAHATYSSSSETHPGIRMSVVWKSVRVLLTRREVCAIDHGIADGRHKKSSVQPG